MWILGLKGLNKNPIGKAENLTNTAAFYSSKYGSAVYVFLLALLQFL